MTDMKSAVIQYSIRYTVWQIVLDITQIWSGSNGQIVYPFIPIIDMFVTFSVILYLMASFRYMPYVILLATSKFARSCGIYLSYDVLKFIHVIQLLFYIKTG